MSKEPLTVAPVELTDRQRARIAVALATYDAQCAALDQGLTLDEVLTATWTVTDDDGREWDHVRKEWRVDHG